jgi:nucleoside-specific outer membrane channel protein Tsx
VLPATVRASAISALVAFEQKLTASDGAAGDLFGRRLAISGGLVVVGAPFDDDSGDASGSAYVFERSGGGWIEVAKLTASDGAAGDRFGTWVAISGGLVLAGAPLDDDDGEDSGSAYVFDGSAGWSEVAKLTASDGATGDQFGVSVAISGDLAVVGALFDDDKGDDSGSAYVFDASTGWSQVAKLAASDGATGDQFGVAVAISGDLALVGAFVADGNGENSGSAYVFDGSAGWSEVAKLTASDGAPGDIFGTSVAISGDLALIGAEFDDDNGDASGSAYVFDRSTGWGEVAKLEASDGAPGDNFGTSVAISGDLALVGAHHHDDNGDDSGSAYVFDRSAGWSEVAQLTASDGTAEDFFGTSVAISGDLALVGANFDDDAGAASGSAYVFELRTNPDTDVLADLVDALPDGVFKSGGDGHRTAMTSILGAIEDDIAAGDIAEAIRKLENLRRHVDGCGTVPGNDDWITDCAVQVDVRNLIDTLIANLGG